MPDALKKPIFGLPRWAWLSILLAAIAIGLYLRHQKRAEEETNGEETVSAAPAGEFLSPSEYEGFGPGGASGEYAGAGSEYPGGSTNELGLEQITDWLERAEARQEAREERLPGEVTVPGNGGEYAPSATGAESAGAFMAPPPEAAHASANKNTHKTTTGGGPPAKPAASTKASGTKSTAKSSGSGKASAIGNAVAVATGNGNSGSGTTHVATNSQGGTPQNNAQHPQAVNTGNQCVNGGVGGHYAPSGYHLFCQGGWIWRAPNS